MIQLSAFRRLPADLPGSCRRTRCPTASYTTPGDTITQSGSNKTRSKIWNQIIECLNFFSDQLELRIYHYGLRQIAGERTIV